MEHKFLQKVFYSDTDAYGVVWHGSYLRWLEMGRIYFCEETTGYNLVELEEKDVVLPVVELDIKYRKPARLNDEVTIKTKVLDHSRCTITFYQTVEKENEKYIEAQVKVAAIHKDGKLYRQIPDIISKIL